MLLLHGGIVRHTGQDWNLLQEKVCKLVKNVNINLIFFGSERISFPEKKDRAIKASMWYKT